jgi:hypothetical protein
MEAVLPPKLHFCQEPHVVTSKKTPFLIVIAVKTSNLTSNQHEFRSVAVDVMPFFLHISSACLSTHLIKERCHIEGMNATIYALSQPTPLFCCTARFILTGAYIDGGRSNVCYGTEEVNSNCHISSAVIRANKFQVLFSMSV